MKKGSQVPVTPTDFAPILALEIRLIAVRLQLHLDGSDAMFDC